MKIAPRFVIVSALMTAPLISLAASQSHDGDLQNRALRESRIIINNLVSIRTSGKSWSEILQNDLPKALDAQCGFMDIIGLPAGTTFNDSREAVSKLAGYRITSSISAQMSRSGAALDLVGTSIDSSSDTKYALVTLLTTPHKAKDKPITLIFEESVKGHMALCDVASGTAVNDGILRNIQRELDEGPELHSNNDL